MSSDNRQFPHLLAPDIAVWRRFLDSRHNSFNRFDYDVRVGQGNHIPDHLPPNIQKMAKDLSQKRIDAVGWKNNHPTIFEITTTPSIKAIGQLAVYPILWQRTFAWEYAPPAVLVADSMHPDLATVLTAYHLPFVILPPPDPDHNPETSQTPEA